MSFIVDSEFDRTFTYIDAYENRLQLNRKQRNKTKVFFPTCSVTEIGDLV